MKVAVIGSGGREHALVWKILKSPLVNSVIAIPGSDAIGDMAKRIDLAIDDIKGILEVIKIEKVDLVVIGPEAPLVIGLADEISAAGIPVFGPSKNASRLEGSKIFSKEFMKRAQIPTANFTSHSDIKSAIASARMHKGPMVVKADGLAAGKGVIICENSLEAEKAIVQLMSDRAFGEAGSKIIIEDKLEGEEASILAICDGNTCIPMVAAQDHKAAFDGDMGPNTGGMGAYAPAPVITENIANEIINKVLLPTVEQMKAEGNPFKGILYAGIMLSNNEPFVLEYNVRFGDPECQPLLMLMKDDIVPLLLSAANGCLEQRNIEWHRGSSICVVLAADGYPGAYSKGDIISGLEDLNDLTDTFVFHAGTRKQGNDFVTAGGRVLGVTSLGEDIREAAAKAYSAAEKISWRGMRMRKDIGYRALKLSNLK